MAFQLQDAHGAALVVPQGATRGAALTGLSGAATTFSTSAVHLLLGGEWQPLVAAVAGGATPTTDAADGSALSVAPGKAKAFVWAFNAAGAVKVFQGKAADYIGSAESTGVEIPALPGDHAAFAVHTIAVSPANGAAFLVGVDNWNTAGVVVGTVKHLAQLPLGPMKTA